MDWPRNAGRRRVDNTVTGDVTLANLGSLREKAQREDVGHRNRKHSAQYTE